MKKILILSLLLGVTVATYAQKATLALNLKQGNTYYMVTSAKMGMTQNINGQTQDITTTIGGKMSFKVTAVKDTTFVMDVKYETLRMQIAAAGVNMDINTESKDTQNPVSAIMANMTHNSFIVTMSNKGRVISVDNFDKLLAAMFEGVPNVTDDQKTQFKSQMMQSFGPTALKGSIEACTAFFPDTKVAKNDKWTIDRTLESAMSVKTRSNYTLQDITATSYLIHADAVVTPGNANDYTEMNGMPMKYMVNGTATTDLSVDKATGWVTDARITQAMKGNIDIKDNPKVPGGMSIPITINVDQTITDK
jgi:hypothetical protein